MTDLSPYQGYLYAYPHKTAYRPLRPRPALRDVWATERRDALFLYLHLPFCEMRCGFCNLFTRAHPEQDEVAAYLAQLRREATVVRDAIGPARFAAGAIGGGTPTYLEPSELDSLLALVRDLAGDDLAGGGAAGGGAAGGAVGAGGAPIPLSVETSPATATPERLAVLAAAGVHRVSIGVQSFIDAEAHAAGRPQRRRQVDAALDALLAAGFPVVNLDLIYGIAGQTAESWQVSLDTAVRYRPAELYLYPLYIRPLTGLGRRVSNVDDDWDRQRLALYRQGRDVLRATGYRQLSMRHFRRAEVAAPAADYCCQEDGMVGLGCGARSYTRDLHYSFDYAVSVAGVRAVIADYLRQSSDDLAHAEVGYRLDGAEQRIRWLVKTLLRVEGCDRSAWRDRFGSELDTDLPQLAGLAERGWLVENAETVSLTEDGLAHSDAVGAVLTSPAVAAAMREYPLR
jgi:coproporphyrinogen III oxidase-like Fe-S oxidoreductase